MLSGVIAFRGQADYLCRCSMPLFGLAGLQRDNYLLRVGEGELVAVPHPVSISGSVR